MQEATDCGNRGQKTHSSTKRATVDSLVAALNIVDFRHSGHVDYLHPGDAISTLISIIGC